MSESSDRIHSSDEASSDAVAPANRTRRAAPTCVDLIIDRRYRILRVSEERNDGDLFEGVEEALGQVIAPVAVKLIWPASDAEQESALREMRSAAKFSHPGLTNYRMAGQIEEGDLAGAIYLVTEAAESTLAEVLKESEGIPQRDVQAMAVEIAQALSFCHHQHAVYGEVRPANIVRVGSGWKLATIGLLHFDTDQRSESQDFEAPASDIFALGETLLACLVAESSDGASTSDEQQSVPDTLPESLSEPWRALLARCLDPEPSERPSADELIKLLEFSTDEDEAPATDSSETPTRAPSVPSSVEAAVEEPPAEETARRWIVSSLGRGEFPTIGEALHQAEEGDTVIVRPGTYRESLHLTRPVKIIGEGALQEIVLVNSDGDTVSIESDATLEGITVQCTADNELSAGHAVHIRRGKVAITGCDIRSHSLACIAVHGAHSHAEIQECGIHEGSETGVYVFDRATVTLEDCDVYDHASSGLVVSGGGRLALKSSQVHHLFASGLFVHEGGQATVHDCTFSSCAKAGVAVGSQATATLENARFQHNLAYGVWYQEDSEGSVRHCQFEANQGAPWLVPEDGSIQLEQNSVVP